MNKNKKHMENFGGDGALIQLVSYGAQDVHLTGNPEMSFLKAVYRRHTHFSIETIEQTIKVLGGGTSKRVSYIISRSGDLLHKIYLNVKNAADDDLNFNGDDIIEFAEIKIGGKLIDTQYGEWNQIYAELNVPESKAAGYKYMTGNTGIKIDNTLKQFQIPLNFWFCRNPGLALPLIALQYQEVQIDIKLSELSDNIPKDAQEYKLWCDYIFLDTEERRRFQKDSHDYLIEQVQIPVSKSLTTGANNINLNFNHTVKEVIWTTPASVSYYTAKLQLNDYPRFSAQPPEYFQLRQPIDHHTAVPGQNILIHDIKKMERKARCSNMTRKINVYSFALNPEEHQPSGTLNFSIIDNAVIRFDGINFPENESHDTKIYAVNYNILRIINGRVGIAFSN